MHRLPRRARRQVHRLLLRHVLRPRRPRSAAAARNHLCRAVRLALHRLLRPAGGPTAARGRHRPDPHALRRPRQAARQHQAVHPRDPLQRCARRRVGVREGAARVRAHHHHRHRAAAARRGEPDPADPARHRHLSQVRRRVDRRRALRHHDAVVLRRRADLQGGGRGPLPPHRQSGNSHVRARRRAALRAALLRLLWRGGAAHGRDARRVRHRRHSRRGARDRARRRAVPLPPPPQPDGPDTAARQAVV
mmetsp:Transcript_25491/g.74423  ORF Transcript_25491/g.74423 Transcript_25491/m.74423 type:complete len:249 (-) Transcript_25491:454-1200(-)